MIEVYSHLYVGNESDYENKVKFQSGWSIVHACKEPYHRQAIGYSGRAAPKTHPEYLIAQRENRLILNLIDVDNVAYIPKEIIDSALDFINAALEMGSKVLIHCNQGYSRSPSIAFLYLASIGEYSGVSIEEAEVKFRSKYPEYQPAKGMRDFIMVNWKHYNYEN